MRSLPVPESVLKRHCEAIAPIFAKKRMQTLQVRLLQHADMSGAGGVISVYHISCIALAPQSAVCAHCAHSIWFGLFTPAFP